jgi:cysteine synthase
MDLIDLSAEIHDRNVYDSAVERLRSLKVQLPTFGELAKAAGPSGGATVDLHNVEPDAPDPANLWRVHWYNAQDRRSVQAVPDYLVLPPELTGTPAKIVVALARNFPLIRAHKVLAAYACMVPRLVTGAFDPAHHRAVWPSTGNYCRGGIAISRILGCRGVAVLPEGMSRERFAWLEQWTDKPDDIVRTQGTESNVKEIYDKCHELAADPQNVILNQFSEFANYLGHYLCTGAAIESVVEDVRRADPQAGLRAFIAATGSAGTLAAGDYLKERHGSQIAAVEALECPTMLVNGYGEHNIQGIGDKHIPLIHNVMNTDYAIAVSDHATDGLMQVFNSEAGRRYLTKRCKVDPAVVGRLDGLGLSGIANIVAAIKLAKYLKAGEESVFATVATDGAELYRSEQESYAARAFPDGFDEVSAAELFGRFMLSAGSDNLIELTRLDRERIFNLGYYTWVEQQGIALTAFDGRRCQRFWSGLREVLPKWDALIHDTNRRTGMAA